MGEKKANHPRWIRGEGAREAEEEKNELRHKLKKFIVKVMIPLPLNRRWL